MNARQMKNMEREIAFKIKEGFDKRNEKVI
jgi:hypothetical protein